MRRSPSRFALSVALAVVVLAACTSTGAPSTTVGGTDDVGDSLPASGQTPVTSGTTLPTTTTTVPSIVADGVGNLDLADAVFDASRVERFRARSEIMSSLEGDEGDEAIVFGSTIEAAYQRSPAAVQVAITTQGAGSGDVMIEIVAIETDYWVRQDRGPWAEDPAAGSLLALASVSLLTPTTLEVVLPVLEEVGEEIVADRPAVHLRGGTEELEVFLAASGAQDLLGALTEVTSGSIDLWLDKAGFVSKAEYEFSGIPARTGEPQFYRASFELSDFDGDFTIAPPD